MMGSKKNNIICKNRCIEFSSFEGKRVIKNAFKNHNTDITKIDTRNYLHDQIWNEIRDNLGLNKKQTYKHNLVNKLNYHVDKMIKEDLNNSTNNEQQLNDGSNDIISVNTETLDQISVIAAKTSSIESSKSKNKINSYADDVADNDENMKGSIQNVEHNFNNYPNSHEEKEQSLSHSSDGSVKKIINTEINKTFQTDTEETTAVLQKEIINIQMSNKQFINTQVPENLKINEHNTHHNINLNKNKITSTEVDETIQVDIGETTDVNLKEKINTQPLTNENMKVQIIDFLQDLELGTECNINLILRDTESDGNELLIAQNKVAKENETINTQVIEDFDNNSKDYELSSTLIEPNNLNNKNNNENNNVQNHELNNVNPKVTSNESIRNNRELKTYNFVLFHESKFTFKWTREEYNKMINKETKKLMTFREAHQLREKTKDMDEKENVTSYHDMIREVHPTCIMYVQEKKKDEINEQRGKIRIHSYCQHMQCKRFILLTTFNVCGSEDIIFKVFEDIHQINHPEGIATQARGKYRIIQQKKTLSKTNRDVIRDEIRKVVNKGNHLNNMGYVSTGSTGRKMAAEARMKKREDKDQFTSLCLMSNQPNTFVHSLSYKPFTLILMNEEMVATVLDAVKMYGALEWYWDSTAGAWKDPRPGVHSPNCLYMYTLLTRFASNSENEKLMTFPLAEAFTVAHNTKNIEIILSIMVNVVERKTSKKIHEIFRVVTTDFSMANINAMIRSFNRLTVVEYIMKCSEIINEMQTDPLFKVKIVAIKLCSSHLSKTFSEVINKFYGNENAEKCNACLNVMKALFNMRNITEIFTLLAKLWMYLLSETLEEEYLTKNDLNDFKIKVTGKTLNLESTKDDNDDEQEINYEINNNNGEKEIYNDDYQNKHILNIEQNDDFFQNVFNKETIYGNSPFYQKAYINFKSIIDTKDSEFEKRNKSCCDFITTLLRRYITYLPLFTPVLTYIQHEGLNKSQNDKANRANNGVIEAHHKDTKNDIRKASNVVGNPPIRLDDFITEVFAKDINCKISMFNLNIRSSNLTRNEKSTEKRKQKKTPTQRNEGRTEKTPKTIQRGKTPTSISKMLISDIKNSKEVFKKRSMKNENEPPKKKFKSPISKSLHSVNMSGITSLELQKTPVAESTPLHHRPAKLNKLIRITPLIDEILSDERTKSVLSNIPEENESNSNVDEDDSKNENENIKSDNNKSSNVHYLTKSTVLHGFDTILENKLFSDINYYIKERSDLCNHLNIVIKDNVCLSYGEFRCLTDEDGNAWLLNFLVDFYLKLIVSISTNKSEITVLPIEDGKCLMGLWEQPTDNEMIEHKNKTVKKLLLRRFNTNVVVLPILHVKHYTCVVIKKEEKEFYFLDPLCPISKALELTKTKYQQFKNFIKPYIDKDKDLEIIFNLIQSLQPTFMKINKQTDSFNCGVHLIHNVQRLIDKKTLFCDDFIPSNYRLQIMKTLITNSDNVEWICPGCSCLQNTRDQTTKSVENSSKRTSCITVDETSQTIADYLHSKNFIDWISCDECLRWWHKDCAKNRHNIVSELYFKCIMCRIENGKKSDE